MAPNRQVSETPLHDFSSEEEEEEVGDGSSSESEEEEEEPLLDNTAASIPKKPQTTFDSDSEEDDSDSTRRPDPNTSKPVADPPKPSKKSRPDPTPSSTPPPKSAGKRPAAAESNDGALDSKRAKKKKQQRKEKEVAAAVINDNNRKAATRKKGKQFQQRLWSEDDEIVILKGLVEFRETKNGSDLNGFHAYVKESLDLGDVSQSQFVARLRRLRIKFENNLKRGRESRDSFFNPHEQLTFDLSKQIWGDQENTDGFEEVGNIAQKGRRNGRGLSERVLKDGQVNAGAIGLDVRVEEFVLKDGLELVSGSKKVEMMEKWRQFRVKELELYLMRSGLVAEQAKLVLEALKKK